MRGTIIATLLVVATQSASAAPGDHIRAGEVQIIPAIDFGAEYRTNIYRAEENPVGGANLRIAPSLSAAADTTDHLFSLGADWQLRKWLFVDESSSSVNNLDTWNDFGINANAKLWRASTLGLDLSNNLNLQNVTSDAEFSDTPFTTHLRDTFNGGLRISPGPALKFIPGVRIGFDDYKVVADTEGNRDFNARTLYGPTLGVRYDFLPRTSWVFDSSYIFNNWRDETVAAGGGGFGSTIEVPDSQHFKLSTGLVGQITEKLGTELRVGYGLAFYQAPTNVADVSAAAGDGINGIKGLTLRAILKYAITEGLKLQGGYDRGFRDSWFTNAVSHNQVYASLGGKAGRFTPALRYSIRFEDFDGEVDRNDVVNRLDASSGVSINDWSSARAGMWWQQRASNGVGVGYDNIGVTAGMTFTY